MLYYKEKLRRIISIVNEDREHENTVSVAMAVNANEYRKELFASEEYMEFRRKWDGVNSSGY